MSAKKPHGNARNTNAWKPPEEKQTSYIKLKVKPGVKNWITKQASCKGETITKLMLDGAKVPKNLR